MMMIYLNFYYKMNMKTNHLISYYVFYVVCSFFSNNLIYLNDHYNYTFFCFFYANDFDFFFCVFYVYLNNSNYSNRHHYHYYFAFFFVESSLSRSVLYVHRYSIFH